MTSSEPYLFLEFPQSLELLEMLLDYNSCLITLQLFRNFLHLAKHLEFLFEVQILQYHILIVLCPFLQCHDSLPPNNHLPFLENRPLSPQLSHCLILKRIILKVVLMECSRKVRIPPMWNPQLW